MGVVWGFYARILMCQVGVVCAIYIGGVVFGGGLLAPTLASLLATSFPNMLECVHIFLECEGDMCCDSHRIIARMGGCVG